MLNLSRFTVSLVVCAFAAICFAPVPALAVNSVGDLKKVEDQVQDVVDKALPCTVCVVSARGGGSGSGVTVSEDGLVLTAAHVIQAAGEDLFVIFPDGRRVKAKSLGANRLRDAGMVQITEPGPYPFAELGKSKDLERNDWCISMGHAGGFQADRTPPVRLGRILANGRFVVTDCTIIGGDSGGPLFDLDGDVIGIHSNIGESLSQNQHVPVDVFTEDWDRMKNGESWGGRPQIDPRQLIMGVQLSPQASDDGVILAGITADSPAEKAGLETGDIIATINGKKMSSPADIIAAVRGKRPGDKLKLNVLRDDEAKDFELRLIRAGELQRDRRPRGRRPDQRGGQRDGQRRRPPSEDKPADPDGRPATEKTQPEAGSEKQNAAPGPTTGKPEDKKPTEKNSGDKNPNAKQKADESSNPAEDKKTNQKGRSIEELMREARRNGGRLELIPEERERLQKFMLERFRNQGGQFGPGWRPPAGAADDWFVKVMEAYEPVVAIASDSTYRVLVDGEQAAFGTAVTPKTLLTKASEIDESDFQVEVADGKRVDAKLVTVYKRYDLALIQISDSSLKPIDLSSGKKELPLGTFLASVGTTDEPSAIGLISVKTRKLASARGFLGVMLEEGDQGIVIRNIVRRSPADKAGLEVNDVILKLNEKSHDNLQNLIKAVGSHEPEQQVKLFVRRGDEDLKITAKLGVQPTNPRSRIERMNQMGGELSDTRSGFPLALQHDCPIEPNACGGPLVNLDGEVVGINIARAGRIKSYALPAYVIQELVAEELAAELSAGKQPAN